MVSDWAIKSGNLSQVMQKIIHIDMDAFYASVEQRDNPGLRGRPIAVGGSPGGRGVVATASYEARKFGVHSAMSSARAMKLCPDLIFVRPRFEAYQAASRIIQEIFRNYTDLVEPLSLDEAYLSVTQNKKEIPFALRIAHLIRVEVLKETGLTCTAGVSYCKFLAKIASGYFKPDGLNYIPVETAQLFIDQLPIDKFHGIGKKTAEKMRQMGIFTGKDLREQPLPILVKRFGKTGRFYHRIANGEDDRQVRTERPRKSASVEDTFPEDLDDLSELDSHIERLTIELLRRLRKKDLAGKTVTLKVKYADFQQVTRSHSFGVEVDDQTAILAVAKEMLRKTEAGSRKVRLLGVGMSNFPGESEPQTGDQLELEW